MGKPRHERQRQLSSKSQHVESSQDRNHGTRQKTHLK
jgi:hypothetical protein